MAWKYWEEINSQFGQCADSEAPDTEQSWKKSLTDRVAAHLMHSFLFGALMSLLPFEKYGHVIKDRHIHRTDE